MTGFKKEKIKMLPPKKAYFKMNNQKKLDGKFTVFYIGLLLFFIGFFSVIALAIYYLYDVPAISKIESDILPESSIIYDRNGGELYNLYSDEKRTYVPYSQIS
jgi:membrane peptidoglycan carboxypeptidase